jgi:hypothetical protein
MTQPVTPENIKRMKPTTPEGHHWDTVRISRPPRNRRAAGGIGRKRVAAPTGKNPRRIGRLLTDPQRKIFDGKVAGKGGVVVIDGSGSMRMSPQDINAITEAAPGCTVLMYASSKRNMHDGGPNLWVLAEKGVMVGEIPDRPSGNGLDAPAVRQALSMKQRHDSPVVWITDGYCHGPGQKYSHQAGAECASLVVRNGVIVRPDVDRAVKTLREMRQGRRAKRWMPIYWRDSWQHIYGQDLSGICGTWEL